MFYLLSSLFLLPSSLFLSKHVRALRHCRDDEKHRNDKSADTIDVMCSLCRYESIPCALLAGATQIMRVGSYKFTHLRLAGFSSADKWNSTTFDELCSFRFFLFLVSISLSLEMKLRYEKSVLIGENADIDCTVNNVKLKSVQNKSQFVWTMNPKTQEKNSYSFQKSVQKCDLPFPFNNARRLAANYASPPSARPALMTYRRHKTRLSLYQLDDNRHKVVQSVYTLRFVTFGSLGTRRSVDAKLLEDGVPLSHEQSKLRTTSDIY